MSVLEIALYALFAVVIVIEVLRLLTVRYMLKHGTVTSRQLKGARSRL
jgi:hypothetical protein